MWGLMGPGEKCVSALLGEGKPWKVLDWLPLRPCPPSSQPRGSGGSVRCRDPADFQARGSPAPLSSASRDPPPTTQVQGKQARTGARGVRSPGTMRCLSFGASSAAERGDGNLPGYLRIEFYGPWMVPVPGPGVETERAPVPVVPAVTYPFSGSGPGWKRWCGKGWEEGGSPGARGRDTWQGHVRARPSPGPSQGWLPRICTQQPWVRWGIRRAWAAAGPGSCGAGGRGEARPRTVPVCAGRGPEPGHWAVKPRGPPSLLSAARGPVPSVVELPTRLSLAVPASLVRSPRTPSDGRIPPVGTPCQLTGAETDGRGWRPGGPRG